MYVIFRAQARKSWQPTVRPSPLTYWATSHARGGNLGELGDGDGNGGGPIFTGGATPPPVNRCSRMENPGPSSAPLMSDDPSQRYQRGLNTLKDTQRMVR